LSAGGAPSARDPFDAMDARVTPALATRVGASYLFDIQGPEGGLWRLDLTRAGAPWVERLDAPRPADCTITVTSAAEWVRLATGRADFKLAYLRRRVRVSGPLRLALALWPLLSSEP